MKNKKLFLPVIALALLGVITSTLLLLIYYNPNFSGELRICGNGFFNSCQVIAQSKFSSLGSLPIATLGLFYFSFIIFSSIIFMKTELNFFILQLNWLLLISAFGVIADFCLLFIMISLGHICTLCLITYIINFLIFLYLLFFRLKIKNNFSKKKFFQAPKNKNFLIVYFLSTILIILFVAIINVSIIRLASEKKPSTTEISKKTEIFFQQNKYDLNLPPSKMVLGNPQAPINIIVFTDFSCSACISFAEVENFILSAFPKDVKFSYYNYPLKNSWENNQLSNNVIAAKILTAAGELGIFEEYAFLHFKSYKKNEEFYNTEFALNLGEEIVAKKDFEEMINCKITNQIIERDISSAQKLKIDATPTIFIGKRKLAGFYNKYVMLALVKEEINRQNKQ